MNNVIYTKKDCPYCVRAKALLTAKGVTYTEVNIGEDIMKEDFVSLFPNVTTVPYIIMEGNPVGGYVSLVEYFNNKKEFLTE